MGSAISEAEEEELFGPYGERKVKHIFAAIHVQSAWRRKEAMRRCSSPRSRRKHKGTAQGAAAPSGGGCGARLANRRHDVGSIIHVAILRVMGFMIGTQGKRRTR